MSIKTITFFVLFLTCSFWLSAQSNLNQGLDSINHSKKPLILSFGLDLKLKSLSGSYDYNYTGEFNKYKSVLGGWEWVNHRTTFNKLLVNSTFTDVKLSVLGASNRNFKIGLGYSFGAISGKIPGPVFDSVNNPGKTIDSVSHDIVYAGISLMMEYDYYFNPEVSDGLYAFANIDLGFYTGTDDIFGPGIPFFIQGKGGIGYNIKNSVSFRAFVATDQLIYRETSTSQVYHKSQYLNMNLSTIYVGLGIVKTFTIFPD